MSEKQVKAFLKWIADAKHRASFEAAKPDDRRAMLKKAKLDITLKEAEAALKGVKGERELADQELDKVAGGDGIVRPPPPPE
jgi:predicted ribosomally synthesized peptide with nif11-like leader